MITGGSLLLSTIYVPNPFASISGVALLLDLTQASVRNKETYASRVASTAFHKIEPYVNKLTSRIESKLPRSLMIVRYQRL